MPALRPSLIDFSDDEVQRIDSFVGANDHGRYDDPLEPPTNRSD